MFNPLVTNAARSVARGQRPREGDGIHFRLPTWVAGGAVSDTRFIIQGRETAYPVGIFAAVHRLQEAGLLTNEEKAAYGEIDHVWFQENLPNRFFLEAPYDFHSPQLFWNNTIPFYAYMLDNIPIM